ncbi:MAG: hypothetical protein EBR82_22495 [Caulobacteraceae bacterium]|nr:hypothetical protein [Caulobacteraceae bacterium]
MSTQLFQCALNLACIALRSWAIQCYWRWFATPIFGVQAPSLLACFGLHGLALVLTYVLPSKIEDHPTEDNLKRAFVTAIWLLLTLATGLLIVNVEGMI